MPLSLRVVIGGVTAAIVLIVASITLAITYTVSIAAIRSTGESLASAMVDTVSYRVEQYFLDMRLPLIAVSNMSKLDGYTLPIDDPDNYNYAPGTSKWAERWVAPLRIVQLEANWIYTTAAIIFDDGSLATTLAHPDTNYTYISDASSAGYRLPNGSVTWDLHWQYWNRHTKKPWNVAALGQPPPAIKSLDARVPGYMTIRSIVGGRDRCLVFPPTPSYPSLAFPPQFVLYGICAFTNGSGTFMGQVSLGRDIKDINSFLRSTIKTPNTQIFAVDGSGLLIATSHPTPATYFFIPGQGVVKEGCSSSLETTSFSPERIGCRSSAAAFPYEPLQQYATSNRASMLTAGRVERFGKLAGKNYYYISHRVQTGFDLFTINLVLFMPEEDVLGNIVAGRNIAIIVTVCVAIVAILASAALMSALLSPIDDVARRMYFTSQLTSEAELTRMKYASKLANDGEERRDQSGNADNNSNAEFFLDSSEDADAESTGSFHRSSMAEIRALQTAYTTMDTAIKSFTKYVPRDVVKELMVSNQICELQMRPVRCSMLFTDIAGFTSICERVPPHILSGLIRLYFDRCSRIVMGHGGMIDKFIGDCIMAVWGAPVPIDHSEIRASVCGRMLVDETESAPLSTEFAKVNETLAVRVGVATGEVLAGNMGSKMRMNYTVIGDDVNLASRLEGLNKQWGTTVMVSEDTAEECADYLHMRYVISIAVVGKQEPVKVYEVLGVNADCKSEALGVITADLSEQRSQNEVRRDEEMAELAKRYAVSGVDDVNAATAAARVVVSAGRLLRRCLRRVTVSPEELAFVRVYERAVAAWNAGMFGDVISTLQQELAQLEAAGSVPSGSGDRLSVRNLVQRAQYLQQNPPSGLWSGVWVATDK